MIDSHNFWAVWATLFLLAAAGAALEKTRIGSRVSGAVLAILLGMGMANLGIAPHTSPVYDIVWAWLLPLGIPLLLLDANLRRVFRESGPMLGACALGAVGAFIGNFVAFHLVPLGEAGWKLASVLTASYIGGSVNFFSMAQALGLEEETALLAAGAAADNLAMASFFVVLFLLPNLPWLRRRYPDRPGLSEESDAVEGATLSEGPPITAQSLTAATAVAFLICAVGFSVGNYLPFSGGPILLITILSVLTATLLGRRVGWFSGHRVLGMGLMQVFFVVIGLSADLRAVLEMAPLLFLYLAIMLTIHLSFLLIGGRVLRFDLRELVLASNVNAGGPTTAAAMAISQRWHSLVVPAILCGTLGYAVANFAGLLMASLIQH